MEKCGLWNKYATIKKSRKKVLMLSLNSICDKKC